MATHCVLAEKSLHRGAWQVAVQMSDGLTEQAHTHARTVTQLTWTLTRSKGAWLRANTTVLQS